MPNKSEVIEIVAVKANMTIAESQRCIHSFLETISECIKEDDNVQLQDFGTFKLKIYASHTGRNPSTGESLEIPEKKSINFKPSNTLKNYLNGKKGKKK